MPRKPRRPPAVRYEHILDALPDLAWVCDAAGELVFLNRAGRGYFGVPLDDMLGWAWDTVVHPLDLPGMLAAWKRAVGTGDPFRADYRLRQHDGVYRWFTGCAHAVAGPRGQVWFGTCADVHTLKTFGNGVRTTQALFEAFVERAGDGFVLFTAEGCVQYASRSFASRLGHAADEFRGRPFHWQVVPDDRVGYATWLNLLLENPGRPLPFRGSFCHRDGSKVELRATGMNLLANADVQAIAVFFTDEGA